MTERSHKVYLGDGVYVDVWGGGLILTTENGSGPPSNIIYLDPHVYIALHQYVARLLPAARSPLHEENR